VRDRQRTIFYLISAAVVVAAGLGSRRFGGYLPVFLSEYAGDTLWALMVFLGISALAVHARLSMRAGAALLFSYLIEISQLYHAPWIDSLRSTTPVALILGFGFLWSDMLCYTVGVGLGVVLEVVVLRRIRTRLSLS